MLEARNTAAASLDQFHSDNAASAVLSAAGVPATKSIFERFVDALDFPSWEDEFDWGDRLAPAYVTARNAGWAAAQQAGQEPLADCVAKITEKQAQASILRDVFGNRFYSKVLPLAWLTADVSSFAQTMYDSRAFDHMPELADAMEWAGCRDGKILSHCRGRGPHVRGCWVVDLLLGKE
jgi:hypothetical protein